MSSKIRKSLGVGLAAAFSAAAVSWLLTSERSPLDEYLLRQPTIRNFWGMLNFPSYLAASLAAGNPHDVSAPVFWTAFIFQWLLIGFLLTALFGMASKQIRR